MPENNVLNPLTYKLLVKISRQRFHVVLLLSIRVHGNLDELEMLKIEKIRFNTVESTIIHQADNETRWQLTRKQLFMIYVAIPARNDHRGWLRGPVGYVVQR